MKNHSSSVSHSFHTTRDLDIANTGIGLQATLKLSDLHNTNMAEKEISTDYNLNSFMWS